MKNPCYRCFLFVLTAISLILVSCKNDEELGFEVQPQGDKIIVGFNNGSGITAYSVRDDSVRSDETLLNMAGSYFDPVFGTTTAGFYIQFRLKDNNVSFGPNPVVDSIVLAMAYGSYYGDISIGQTFRVYEVTQDFYRDSAYYSNKRFSINTTLLADHFFVPKPNDSVTVFTTRYAPHLRIRLDDAFGQHFLDQSGNANLSDNTNFLSFFKGLYVVAEPSSVKAAMLYFSLLSVPSSLAIYYHNDDADSLIYGFAINENSARVNTFEHYGYAGANHDFQQQIAGDTVRGNQILYLQAMAGTKTFIRFQGLRSLFQDNSIVVNKAELIVPVEGDNDGFVKPAQLTLVRINSDSSLSFLPDELYGSAYFGGVYDPARTAYSFNIATYIQNMLINEDYGGVGLYLSISGASVKGDRLVINGPAHPDNNLRLEITYTKIH